MEEICQQKARHIFHQVSSMTDKLLKFKCIVMQVTDIFVLIVCSKCMKFIFYIYVYLFIYTYIHTNKIIILSIVLHGFKT